MYMPWNVLESRCRNVVFVDENKFLLRGPVSHINTVSTVIRAVLVLMASMAEPNVGMMVVSSVVHLYLTTVLIRTLPYYDITVNIIKCCVYLTTAMLHMLSGVAMVCDTAIDIKIYMFAFAVSGMMSVMWSDVIL